MSPRNFRWSMDVMLCPWCCMGRKARPWGRAGQVPDADDVCFCLTPVSLACSICVLVSAAWVLEFQNQYHCSRLCLWYFWFHAGVDAGFFLVVAAPRWYVASCAFIGIVSEELARPCSVDLSVSSQTKVEPVVGLQMDAKNGVFRPRFVGKRITGLPLLMLNTQCSLVWVR